MTHEDREGPPSQTDLDTFLAALSPNAIAMFFYLYGNIPKFIASYLNDGGLLIPAVNE